MANKRHFIALSSALILVAACSTTAQSTSPMVDASTDPAVSWVDADKGSYSPSAEPVILGSVSNNSDTMVIKSNVSSADVPFQYRETVVSRKVQQLSNDQSKIKQFADSYDDKLRSLQASSEATTKNYYDVIAGINAHLQRGTTPGNPILIEKAQVAQQRLDALSSDVTNLNVLANDIASNASLASYLMEAIRATYGVSGAVDEDHQSLKELEDKVNNLNVQADRQLNEVNEDINRRTSYLSSERRNLQTLSLAIANGELYGQSLANRSYFSPASALPGSAPLGMAKAPVNSSKPLVVIRFDRPNVDFEQAVYLAASQALEKYPNVSFEVVAVAPAGVNPAQSALATTDSQNNAEAVLRSMSQMGIPGNRVALSSAKSPAARSSEVHIFIR